MLVALLAMASIATAKTPKKKPLRRSIETSLPSGYTSNDKVAFGVWHDDEYGWGSSIDHYSGFDIRVKGEGGWYGTTYYDEGYATVIQVDGANKQMIYGKDNTDGQKFAFDKVYKVDGIEVSISAQIPAETPDVVEITYHVKNTNSVAKTIDLGSCADTQVGTTDGAQVSKSGNKITMSDGTLSYSLVVKNSANPTAVTRVWYGDYEYCIDNVFSNSADGDIPLYSEDTGTAWSWHFTLGAGAEEEYVVGGIVGSSVADSSDAIDLNVPANLGDMTPATAGQITDLAAFLEEYQKIHVNPPYIKLTLEPSAKYVISRPLTTMSAITIVGDEENPAIIDASQLGSNPFVKIKATSEAVSAEPNGKGFYTSIYTVEFKNFIVEEARGSLFSSNGQKYDIPYMTIDNVVYGAWFSYAPLISLLNGGIVENLTMTRSTAFTSGYLYNGYGSAKLAEAGVNSQKFTFSYNTLMFTKGLVHADDSESAKRTITVDHNVILENTAGFVAGLNAGDANWIVQYNAFQKEINTSNANGDYVFDDLSNTEDANGAAGSIKGNLVWVNTKKLFEDLWDGVINFPMGDCPQRDAKIGDPRWLSAKMRIKEADIDDDNDLAKVINEGVKKGYSEFELVQNQYGNLRYTVKQSIVTDKAISITGENVQIDVESGADFIKVANVAGEKAKKADGSDSNYTIVENITLKGLTINGLTKSLINNTSGNVVFTKISIDDDVIDFSGSSAVFALGNGYPEDLTITKSTLWSQAGHTGYLFQAQGRPKDATGSTSWTIEKSTLYQIAKGKKMNNNNSGIKGQSTTKLTLTESILFETGSNTGNEINGWLFGQNSASPVRTYNKNTYWAGNAEATGWTDSSKTGSDQTGTALTTDPGFKDAANGDFTLSAYSAQLSEQTGDPRWFAEGGHYNPVTGIETVKTAEETSLENAVIYNLNGQRVEKAQKGINIVNGKKVIIK